MRRMLGPAGRARPCWTSAAARASWRCSPAAGGRRAAGIDVAPFFLPRAAREVDLVLGDLRRLPFRKAAFPRAFSLDVLEHLDEAGVRDVLVEARRTLPLRPALRVHPCHGVVAARPVPAGGEPPGPAAGRGGLIDHEREALRKSDHRNAIRSHEHFESCARRRGCAWPSAATTTSCSRR